MSVCVWRYSQLLFRWLAGNDISREVGLFATDIQVNIETFISSVDRRGIGGGRRSGAAY